MKTDDDGRPMTSIERNRRYRHKMQAAGGNPYAADRAKAVARVQAMRARNRNNLPFIGVDGEGWDTDQLGRQCYQLMRAGSQELYTGKPLTTRQCLDFILELPPAKDAILCGFGFNYDVTMMLIRDLPEHRVAKLLEDWDDQAHVDHWTYWGGYALKYLSRNYLKVARTKQKITKHGEVIPSVIRGTVRTIYDVHGCFQSSFLAALEAFGIGVEHHAMIGRQKDHRGQFSTAEAAEIRRYCATECELLGELMSEYRRHANNAGIFPRSWAGAGKLADQLHRDHRTPTAELIDSLVPEPVREFGRKAYYGGRFEIACTGLLEGAHGYDLRSAYPAMMPRLPCLIHGSWRPVKGRQIAALPADALFVAEARFAHPWGSYLCGLPIRDDKGSLSWPLEGRGVYWSCEIKAAMKLGAEIRYGEGFVYQRRCQCQPFDWVPALFQRRLLSEKEVSKAAGIPLKLAINSLYGKLAQRIGSAEFHNLLWAGLITALVRAELMAAVAPIAGNDMVAMIATDGLYTRCEMPWLHVANELGAWEKDEKPISLFLAQPGVYWGGKRPKTRGISMKTLEHHIPDLEADWRDYAARARSGLSHAVPPTTPIRVTLFIGLRLAQAWGKLDMAGRWIGAPLEPPGAWDPRGIRHISFDWSKKRGAVSRWDDNGLCVRHLPLEGGRDVSTRYYSADDELIEAYDEFRVMMADQPDVE